ncbi:MAG: hypothetical protein QOE58_1203 [Actinomycetota bacterium]|nr:hypothetical protein [Actinomycetota bacterium]
MGVDLGVKTLAVVADEQGRETDSSRPASDQMGRVPHAEPATTVFAPGRHSLRVRPLTDP